MPALLKSKCVCVCVWGGGVVDAVFFFIFQWVVGSSSSITTNVRIKF